MKRLAAIKNSPLHRKATETSTLFFQRLLCTTIFYSFCKLLHLGMCDTTYYQPKKQRFVTGKKNYTKKNAIRTCPIKHTNMQKKKKKKPLNETDG